MKIALLMMLLVVPTVAAAASPIEGNWRNPRGSVTVHIGSCGPTLCGRVISASAGARADAAGAGTPQLVGTELMSGLEPVGEGAWRGDIFVPDRNVRAEGELHLMGPRTLEIEGCAMGGLICKTQTWTRVGAGARRKR
jgi:uncharacterized protein (DUF2147 family)